MIPTSGKQRSDVAGVTFGPTLESRLQYIQGLTPYQKFITYYITLSNVRLAINFEGQGHERYTFKFEFYSIFI